MEMPFRHFHENNKDAQLTRITMKANQSKHLVSVVSHDRLGRYGQTVFNQMMAYRILTCLSRFFSFSCR